LLALVLITPKAASPQPQAFARSGADHAKGGCRKQPQAFARSGADHANGGCGLRGGFAAAAGLCSLWC